MLSPNCQVRIQEFQPPLAVHDTTVQIRGMQAGAMIALNSGYGRTFLETARRLSLYEGD